MNETEQIIQLKNIVKEFEESIQKVTMLALDSPKGGDENWYTLLKKYNGEPSTMAQKEAFYSYGFPVGKGAFPAELRKVYQHIRYETVKKFRGEFENIDLSIDAEMYWDDFTDKLDSFIDEKINTYIGKIKQEVNVSNIFANAFSGMNKFSHGLKESGTNTKQCNSCGSPRLDNDQYDECYFCGTPLFETKKVTAKCKICGSPMFIEDQDKECQFCGN